MADLPLCVDGTLFEKAAAPQELRTARTLFRYAWRHHLGRVLPTPASTDFLTVAALAHRARWQRVAVEKAARAAIKQVRDDRPANTGPTYVVALRSREREPFLWAVNYHSWAVQRAYEIGDRTWLDAVAGKVNEIQTPFSAHLGSPPGEET